MIWLLERYANESLFLWHDLNSYLMSNNFFIYSFMLCNIYLFREGSPRGSLSSSVTESLLSSLQASESNVNWSLLRSGGD